MAEILVKAIDMTHEDPDIDRRGCYKRGMPVVVMPDGHTWGKEECLPKFIVIKVPGVSVEALKKYIEPDMVLNDKVDPGDTSTFLSINQRRKWKINFDTLDKGIVDKLKASGEIIVKVADSPIKSMDCTWDSVKQAFVDTKTNLTESATLVIGKR